MSKIALTPNASGSGTFTLASPNSNTDRTLTLPDSAGTIATTNGITVADLWRLTGNLTVDTTPITTWEQASSEADHGQVGSSMSLSSGVFTFPETGMYTITVQADMQSETASTLTLKTRVSTDGGSNYNDRAYAIVRNTNSGGDARATAYSQMILDVTSTANIKVRFDFDMAITGSQIYGNTDITITSVMFMRLGDT